MSKLKEDQEKAVEFLGKVRHDLENLRNMEQQLVGRIQLYEELLNEHEETEKGDEK